MFRKIFSCIFPQETQVQQKAFEHSVQFKSDAEPKGTSEATKKSVPLELREADPGVESEGTLVSKDIPFMAIKLKNSGNALKDVLMKNLKPHVSFTENNADDSASTQSALRNPAQEKQKHQLKSILKNRRIEGEQRPQDISAAVRSDSDSFSKLTGDQQEIFIESLRDHDKVNMSKPSYLKFKEENSSNYEEILAYQPLHSERLRLHLIKRGCENEIAKQEKLANTHRTLIQEIKSRSVNGKYSKEMLELLRQTELELSECQKKAALIKEKHSIAIGSIINLEPKLQDAKQKVFSGLSRNQLTLARHINKRD